jgi:hypothetical protein
VAPGSPWYSVMQNRRDYVVKPEFGTRESGVREDPVLQFDEGNASELARHRITPYEVREVLSNEPVWGRNKRARAGNFVMYGRTDGGRPLSIVVLLQDDILRPITGWDMTTGERTRYLRRR